RMSVWRFLLTGAALALTTAHAAAQTPTTPAQPSAPSQPAPPPPQPSAPSQPAPPPLLPPPGAPPVTSAQSQVFGKVLSVDDAVAIALETQPNIKARISDYIAAAFRVDQALSTLFPQITGQWTAARDQNVVGGTLTTGTVLPKTITTWTTTSIARV